MRRLRRKEKTMEKEKYDGAIRRIADTYGLYNQRDKLIKELSELLVAITHDYFGNTLEEMADVRIMIDQMTYLYDAKDVVEKLMEKKIKRTLEIMEG